MTDEKLNETFFQDSREFLDTFAEALDELTRSEGTSQPPRDAVDKSFRAIHSLKSEAAYLGFEAVASRSNEMETLLQGLREGKDPRPVIEELTRGFVDLRNAVEDLKGSAGGSGEPVLKAADSPEKTAPRIRFTDFELSLLSEARERGERFYRVLTEVEEAETMVYPRLFLLISNLELEVNVVRTVPDLSEISPEKREIEIFLTAAMKRENLYRIVNIDQIARVQITELDYPTVITEGELASAMTGTRDAGFGRRTYLTVDTDKLEELGKGLEEIELLSGRLEDENDIVKRLKKLASHCSETVSRLRLRRLAEELERMKRFAEEFAERQGKKVRVDSSGGGFEVESTFLDHLQKS